VQFAILASSTGFLEEVGQALVSRNRTGVLGIQLLHRDVMRAADPEGESSEDTGQ
jgi:hypothetical protein